MVFNKKINVKFWQNNKKLSKKEVILIVIAHVLLDPGIWWRETWWGIFKIWLSFQTNNWQLLLGSKKTRIYFVLFYLKPIKTKIFELFPEKIFYNGIVFVIQAQTMGKIGFGEEKKGQDYSLKNQLDDLRVIFTCHMLWFCLLMSNFDKNLQEKWQRAYFRLI